MSAHARTGARATNPVGGGTGGAGGGAGGGPAMSGGAAAQLNHPPPPPPTYILPPAEVKRQFSQHADFQAYSRSVKKYLNGAITKSEFHAELAKILPTKDKLALHNWMILSILRSAYVDYNAQKKGAVAHAGGPGGGHKAQNLRGLSDHRIFKLKMHKTAAQNGLTGVSDDAVSMVVVALQQHLLRTLAAVRASESKNPTFDDIPDDMTVTESTVPGNIDTDDLSGAVWRNPSILHESASSTQCRLALESPY